MTPGSTFDRELDLFSESAGALERLEAALPRRLNADPEDLEKGLAHLVLTLVELLRELMERQALRRIESGTLSDEQIERLGQTFMALSDRMEELKRVFGLEDEELNLNLGPLGNLL
ncbi:MAG: gas vesicle protein K [Solirubrobacterales bacterium]|nr:gas vesicle protein K [Solirubrobacterales bacterium]